MIGQGSVVGGRAGGVVGRWAGRQVGWWEKGVWGALGLSISVAVTQVASACDHDRGRIPYGHQGKRQESRQGVVWKSSSHVGWMVNSTQQPCNTTHNTSHHKHSHTTHRHMHTHSHSHHSHTATCEARKDMEPASDRKRRVGMGGPGSSEEEGSGNTYALLRAP